MSSENTALQAPRNLNAPMRCRFSHLKCNWQPASASSERERSTGVTCASCAMRAAALRMSDRVGVWVLGSIGFPAQHCGLWLAQREGHGMRSMDYRRKSRSAACWRSEEHTSELQSLMRISYAVFCLKKKTEKL